METKELVPGLELSWAMKGLKQDGDAQHSESRFWWGGDLCHARVKPV
jgi:hypothetical protein